MIQQLYVRDFAVIDEMELQFGAGMNLLTGETGSGKSVIVDAVGIALGERADTETVRTGCEKAVVEAVLDISDSPTALRVLGEAGFDAEDGTIIVSREVHKTGKSQCRINGRPATVSILKSITDRLVDTHGQHEHQFLLRAESHLGVVDSWCGADASSVAARVSEGYAELRRLRDELKRLQSDERDRVRMIDLYQFQAKEIQDAKLAPDEEEELLADRVRLANAEKLRAAASTAFEQIGDRMEERCALDSLSEAVLTLQGIADVDPELQQILETLQSALYQVEDATHELRGYRDAIEFNPDRLESVEERLELIRTLKRKYGDTVGDILSYGKDVEQRLESLVNSDERAVDLQSEIEKVQTCVMEDARRLSEVRRKGAEAFSKGVEKELHGLSMPDTVFDVSFVEQELDSSGIDKVEFLISANAGEPPRPLAKIASGGEMSRVMLAIKSVMSAVDNMPTLVFDEIDVGVGGRTAEVIGRKLDSLASRSQVLCITHLPQIACLSGEHFYIEKQLHDGRTVVRVRRLSSEERVAELARMLAGSNPSETAVRHAQEMLGIA